MDILEERYIELLLKRCLNFEQGKSLLINIDLKENLPFANKLKVRALAMGILDTRINLLDQDNIHAYLAATPVDDITNSPLIDRGPWSEYARKGGSLLLLTSVVPGLMSDIEPAKITKWIEQRNVHNAYYIANVHLNTFPWTIAALPNRRWAELVFPNDPDAYNKLYMKILEACMADQPDPLVAWQDFINQSNYYKDKLNELMITDLYYKNSLGTDLHVVKNADSRWLNLDKLDAHGNPLIVNMPSYEIFSSPDRRLTEGIVYGSRPFLVDGNIVEDFYLEFEKGQVVNFKAGTGQEALKRLINADGGSSWLGEVAIVEKGTPIEKTGIIFYETLFDENSSCHLALGSGTPRVLPNYQNMSVDEIYEAGINESSVHADFMIGTDDLEITATTNRGRVRIVKNNKFDI